MALDFLSNAPPGMDRVLQMLANAESLTDDVAKRVFSLAPIEGISADLFIRALHYADFVEPRNSEWNFSPSVRSELQKLNVADPYVVREANRMLAELGRTADRSLAGSVVPSYLFTSAGQAYHEAAAGNIDHALSMYSQAARGRLTGIQWLASNLAAEQEERRILPPNRIETTFLRAMVMFREGERQAAEPLFRRIARTDEARFEVAVALSILGNLVGRRNRAEAEKIFLRSIEIDEKLDNPRGVGQTLHSLANLLARDPKRAKEAEERYLRSIEIGEEIENQHHVAQTLHSLANLLAGDPKRAKEAEERYLRSIEIDEKLDNPRGVAQTLHSLANLLARDPKRAKEAEERYLRSIEIDEKLDNPRGVAQTLHSLANLLARDPKRAKEAEERYLRSIEIGEEIENQHHVAQTLHSLANLLARDPKRAKEAETRLQRSLQLGQQTKDLNHQAQVLRSLSFIVERRSPKEAEELLQQSLDLNKRANNRRGQQIVDASLRALHNRHKF